MVFGLWFRQLANDRRRRVLTVHNVATRIQTSAVGQNAFGSDQTETGESPPNVASGMNRSNRLLFVDRFSVAKRVFGRSKWTRAMSMREYGHELPQLQKGRSGIFAGDFVIGN